MVDEHNDELERMKQEALDKVKADAATITGIADEHLISSDPGVPLIKEEKPLKDKVINFTGSPKQPDMLKPFSTLVKEAYGFEQNVAFAMKKHGIPGIAMGAAQIALLIEIRDLLRDIYISLDASQIETGVGRRAYRPKGK